VCVFVEYDIGEYRAHSQEEKNTYILLRPKLYCYCWYLCISDCF